MEREHLTMDWSMCVHTTADTRGSRDRPPRLRCCGAGYGQLPDPVAPCPAYLAHLPIPEHPAAIARQLGCCSKGRAVGRGPVGHGSSRWPWAPCVTGRLDGRPGCDDVDESLSAMCCRFHGLPAILGLVNASKREPGGCLDRRCAVLGIWYHAELSVTQSVTQSVSQSVSLSVQSVQSVVLRGGGP